MRAPQRLLPVGAVADRRSSSGNFLFWDPEVARVLELILKRGAATPAPDNVSKR